jgi:hypothetical protein
MDKFTSMAELFGDDDNRHYSVEISPALYGNNLQKIELTSLPENERMWAEVDQTELHRYLCYHALPHVTVITARSPHGPIWFQTEGQSARVRVWRTDDRPWELEILNGNGHELAACLIFATDELLERQKMETRSDH